MGFTYLHDVVGRDQREKAKEILNSHKYDVNEKVWTLELIYSFIDVILNDFFGILFWMFGDHLVIGSLSL